MFQRFSDEGLAQSSYLVACDRTRAAAVVDPRRDIDAYVEAARRHGLTLAYAIETHTHADFVSGARELAAVGAQVIAGPGAALQYPYHEGRHGERLALGDVGLELLHTPGHTPEHVSVVVREPGARVRVLTGDTLFVGAVGRPDLVGAGQTRALAEALYDSLFDVLLRLDGDVEVHPGHGAGSLCGAGIGNAPSSTIGQERRFNPLLQQRTRDGFVEAVIADLPETPPYFARMKRINRAGPSVLGLDRGVPAIGALTSDAAKQLHAAGATVIDLRTADAFAAGHPGGAINIGFGARVGYWAGWIVPPDATLVLLSGAAAPGEDASQREDVRRQLLRVGLDSVAGYVDGGYDAWRASGGSTTAIDLVTARELRERLERREAITVVDVRSAREWEDGHIDGAVNIPVPELTDRAGDLRGRAPVATICETGFRSSLAASLLQRAGVDVINVRDGIAAYRGLD